MAAGLGGSRAPEDRRGRRPHLPGLRYESLAVGVAVGYTQVTGRMQAVLLHAGSGLLQGAMGLQGARSYEVPMVVMSGESLSYGEIADFDPGNQWYRNLGVVGGPQRLVDFVVKWANQAPSPESSTRAWYAPAKWPSACRPARST